MRPPVEPQVGTVEPLARPLRRPVDARLVLLLAHERRVADLQPVPHQVVKRFTGRPEHFRSQVHLRPVGLVERPCGFVPVRVGEVRRHPLPLAPQVRPVGPTDDRLVGRRLPVPRPVPTVQFPDDRLPVNRRADHHDVRRRPAHVQHSPPEPVQLPPPQGRAVGVIVLVRVVHHDQRRAAFAVLEAADTAPHPAGLDHAPVAELNQVIPPDRPAAGRVRVAGPDPLVVLQFRPDVPQEGVRLLGRLAQDQRVRLHALQGGPTDVPRRVPHRLAAAPRGQPVPPPAANRVEGGQFLLDVPVHRGRVGRQVVA